MVFRALRDRLGLLQIKFCFTAGSTLGPEIFRMMRAIGLDLLQVYGASETGVSGHTRTNIKVDSVGMLSPHTTIRILEDGHILAIAPSRALGYYKNEEATAEAIDEEGWLHSGDLAVMDDRGYVKIVGRKKDMYICGGFNVYPREIEEFLFKLHVVENVSVLGVPDPKFGEVGLAVIKATEGMNPTVDNIINHCKVNLANFKVPKYVWFIDEYPMTQSGKVQKFKLLEMAIEKFGLSS